VNALGYFANGVGIFDDDFYRGVGCMAGFIPTHEIPVVQTDNAAVLAAIDAAGGFGFAVTRLVKPGLFSFQRGIDGVTHSPWGHAVMLVGEAMGLAARVSNPGRVLLHKSERWVNTAPGYPDHLAGLPMNKWKAASRYETVESKALVEATDLRDSLNPSTQTIVFTNPAWTPQQKLAMAIEAYSWVGEPYDVFEVAHWVAPLVPNPAALKDCSTLVLACIAAGDPGIKDWCRLHGLDPELVAPGHIFAYGADKGYGAHCFGCTMDGAMAAL
jgi:hypothetical protein